MGNDRLTRAYFRAVGKTFKDDERGRRRQRQRLDIRADIDRTMKRAACFNFLFSPGVRSLNDRKFLEQVNYTTLFVRCAKNI